MLTIQEIGITIKHKPGAKNANADALSRCPADATKDDISDETVVTMADSPLSPDLTQLESLLLKYRK